MDELDVERIPTVDDELVEAFQALNTDDFDGHLDEMYGWLVGNSSEATHAGSTSSKTRFGRTVGLDLGTTNSAAAVVDADGVDAAAPSAGEIIRPPPVRDRDQGVDQKTLAEDALYQAAHRRRVGRQGFP